MPDALVFTDCFSDGSEDYARYRPTYPDALYDQLLPLVPSLGLCWDCATGNGQAALALAQRFDQVVATDASANQLAKAFPHPRITYRREVAERTSLGDGSVDLVTVAAALHWLDLAAFYREVSRVLRPGGVLAAWTYGVRPECTPGVDAVLAHDLEAVLAPHIRPQLQHVAARYQGLAFPFEEITLAPVSIVVQWTLEDLVGLLDTWSAAAAYRRQHGHRATDRIRGKLTAAWCADGSPETPRPVRLPLHTRVGKHVAA